MACRIAERPSKWVTPGRGVGRPGRAKVGRGGRLERGRGHNEKGGGGGGAEQEQGEVGGRTSRKHAHRAIMMAPRVAQPLTPKVATVMGMKGAIMM